METTKKAEFLFDYLHSCEPDSINLLHAIAQLRSFSRDELYKVSYFINQLYTDSNGKQDF